MPAYTKADFIAAYPWIARWPIPDGANTPPKFHHYNGPPFEGMVDYVPGPQNGVTFRLPYWPAYYRKQAMIRANGKRKADGSLLDPDAPGLVQWLIDQGTPLSGTDSLVIIGGAYGWLGEALMAMFPGLAAVSVDLSQYVQDTKDSDPNAELIEQIAAAGFDHTLSNSVGEYLYNAFQDSLPKATIQIAQEDLSNNGSRNRVRAKLPRNATRIITEEVWYLMTPTEQGYVNQASATWSIPVTHIMFEQFYDGTA